MNLIGDPWIPVVTEEGCSESVGLKDLFLRAESIRDLSLRPPQRIAVMRLLLCITHAALDGPFDTPDWRTCRARIVPASLDYLDRQYDRFHLFGEHPLLQFPSLTSGKSDEAATVDKLDFGLASGNNDTLYDHEAVGPLRKSSPAWTALHLLTFQNFSPGGLVGEASWCGVKYPKNGTAAPCAKLAHTFIRGKNLLETVHWNLLTKTNIREFPNGKWGTPVWEVYPHSPEDGAAFENATRTYLGRLVPLSRLVLVCPDAEPSAGIAACRVGAPPSALEFPTYPEYREPSSTATLNAKNEPYCLTLTPGRHIWRDLNAVLALAHNQSGGAPALMNLRTLDSGEDPLVEIWVGGLATDRAKIVDTMEWNLIIPLSLFGEPSLQLYQTGITLSNNTSGTLCSAVKQYAKEMKISTDSGSAGQSLQEKASTEYWSLLDSRYPVLLECAATMSNFDQWRQAVRIAMHDAFRSACPHVTPRQIQAYAKAKFLLHVPDSVPA